MIKISSTETNKLRLQKKVKDYKPAKVVKIKEEKVVVDANAVATKELASAIKELAVNKGEPQQDLMPLVDAMTKIQKTQGELLEMLAKNKAAKEWSFAVKRDFKGNIETISARGK